MNQHRPDTTATTTTGSRRALWVGTAVAGALLVSGGGLAMAAPGGQAAAHKPTSTSTATHGKPTDAGKPTASHGKPTDAGTKAHGVVSVFSGTVTAVSDTSITITSKKGEDKTFAITAATAFDHSGGGQNPGQGKAGEKGQKPTAKPTQAQVPTAKPTQAKAKATHTAADIKVGDTVRVTGNSAGEAIAIVDSAWLGGGKADAKGSAKTKAPKGKSSKTEAPAPTSEVPAPAPTTDAPAPVPTDAPTSTPTA